MENIYLHAIYAFNNHYSQQDTVRILKHILKSNAFLSRRLQMYRDPYGFNGLDYISLCDYDKRNIHHEGLPNYTAYISYIRESLSLIIPKDKITAIKPQIVDFIGICEENIETMLELGLSENERYSDLYDEVQVKDRIPLSLVTGVTMPIRKMTKPLYPESFAIYFVQKQIEQIKELLIKYNHELPMYDMDTFTSLEESQNVKKLVKENYKRNIAK